MSALPKLFKRASTGKVQEWEIVVEGDSYHTISGQVGGKLTTSKPTTCKGKNTGKSNATTPEEQALADARAKWTKKKDEGYAESAEDVDSAVEGVIKPMLAQPWDDVIGTKHAISFPCISQPKLDGVRCIVTRDQMMSRKWKPIVACPHILEALKALFVEFPDLLALDGELYNHKFHDEFHEIISLVRKTKPTEEDLAESKKWIEYHVYDVVFKEKQPSNLDRDLWRHKNLKDYDGVVIVPSEYIQTQEELDAEYERLMEAGYEGQMVRRWAAKYEHKRSFDLLKRKMFVDKEFLITGWEPCVGNREGTFSFVCECEVDGETKTFVAPLNGTVEYLRSLWDKRDSFIGQYCTVTYFPPPKGALPRFPRCKSLRPVDSDGEPEL